VLSESLRFGQAEKSLLCGLTTKHWSLPATKPTLYKVNPSYRISSYLPVAFQPASAAGSSNSHFVTSTSGNVE